jgi:hypothetical protein
MLCQHPVQDQRDEVLLRREKGVRVTDPFSTRGDLSRSGPHLRLLSIAPRHSARQALGALLRGAPCYDRGKRSAPCDLAVIAGRICLAEKQLGGKDVTPVAFPTARRPEPTHSAASVGIAAISARLVLLSRSRS